MQYDYLVFIGRFQPVHLGHLKVIEAAMQQAAKLIVICGSARQASSPRNPFTLDQREDMLRAALPTEWQDRVFVVGCSDRMYNDQQWVTEVQNLVDKVIAVDTLSLGKSEAQFRIGTIGSPSRRHTWYLDLFPQWQRVEVADEPVSTPAMCANVCLMKMALALPNRRRVCQSPCMAGCSNFALVPLMRSWPRNTAISRITAKRGPMRRIRPPLSLPMRW